jgi:hypothetical protein
MNRFRPRQSYCSPIHLHVFPRSLIPVRNPARAIFLPHSPDTLEISSDPDFIAFGFFLLHCGRSKRKAVPLLKVDPEVR